MFDTLVNHTITDDSASVAEDFTTMFGLEDLSELPPPPLQP